MRLIACAFALAALPCMLSAQSTRRKPPRLARNMSNLRTLALSIGLAVASALPVTAQVDSTWTEAFPPFHIAGNLLRRHQSPRQLPRHDA